MDAESQSALVNVLTGYFSDQTLADGVTEMLFVTRHRADYHEAYVNALETGLTAARRGDPDVVTVIRQNLAPFLRDINEARVLMEEILTEYRARYAELADG